MRPVLAVVLLFVSACVTTQPAVRRVPEGPMPEVTEDTIHYEVEGNTSAELRAALDRLGPEDDSGRHDAYTKWYVRWFYDYERSEAACSLKNVRATLEVTYTLPRWQGANGALGERWHRYLTALRTHEKGHAQNGVDAARFIVTELSKLPAQPDCDAAATNANAKANAELATARARDRAYDEETKHGATQGATFR